MITQEQAEDIKKIFALYPDDTTAGYKERCKALYNHLAIKFEHWDSTLSYLVSMDREFGSTVCLCDNLSSAIKYIVTDYLQYWNEYSNYSKDDVLYLVPFNKGIQIVRKDVMDSKDE